MSKITPSVMVSLTNEFLKEAEDDVVGLWEIVKVLEDRHGVEDEALLEQSLEVVQELLANGFLAGDPPYSAGGYRPWADQRPDAVFDRIRSEWIALGHTPNIPDIVWFSRPDRV